MYRQKKNFIYVDIKVEVIYPKRKIVIEITRVKE